MKKFLASLLIVALFSGFVFYIGWTQIKVKPESVGVVISKTDGIDMVPVENGKFSWHKQFLFPTNAVLKIFSIKPVNVDTTISGALPSISGYDFSYSFDFTISLTVAPEVIPELLEQNKITNQDDLNIYLTNAAKTIAQLSAEYMLKKAEENSSFRPESVRRDDLLRNIKIYNEFPEIDLSVFAVTKSKIPDYNAYKRLQYQSFESVMESDSKNTFDNETINSEGEVL